MDISTRFVLIFMSLVLFLVVMFSALNNKELVDVTLSWHVSEEFEDGSLLSPHEIESYEIQWRELNGKPLGKVVLSRDTQSYKIYDLAVGEYMFSIVAISVYGTLSKPFIAVKTLGSVKSII